MEDGIGRYALALEEARRTSDMQARDLDNLRSRTLSLLGTGGLVAAFFGGVIAGYGHTTTVWTCIAVGAFCVLVALAVFILWPRRFWFPQDPAIIVGWVDEFDADIDLQTRDLALHVGEQNTKNSETIRCLMRVYCVAIVVLVPRV